MISQREIKGFWKSFWWIMIKWNLVSFFGFISTAVIWAFILKHVFKVKTKFWLLNDTEGDFDSGDFGAEWWLEDNDTGFLISNAIKWWFRNHSWNYISKYNPEWNNGENEEYLIIKNTVGNEINQYHKDFDKEKWENGIYSWLKKDIEKECELYVAYRINGVVYCRYSKVRKDWTGRWRQYQKGVGGRRYRLNRKPII